MQKQRLNRADLLDKLADHLCRISSPHTLRVGVDGIDTAGKTTFADELAHHIHQLHRPTIRACVDGFHHPRHIRYRRGSLSPEGYYQDAFDYAALIQALLVPLGPTGDRQYRTQTFDYLSDRPIDSLLQQALPNAILIVDGVFLQRSELRPYWDVTILLDIPFETVLARAMQRDRALFGTDEAIHERYTQRYIPAQQIYRQQCRPHDCADIVIDTTDPAYPLLSWRAEQRSNE
jgi:uridine kinase